MNPCKGTIMSLQSRMGLPSEEGLLAVFRDGGRFIRQRFLILAEGSDMIRIAGHLLTVVAVVVLSGSAFGANGPNSSAAPYLVGVTPGVSFTSILTAGDSVGGYTMGGIPDGLGAYDNNDGTFTVLMNHEWGSTVGAGNVHTHGAIGGYQSRWVVRKSDLAVTSGGDLIQQVYNWDTVTQASSGTASTVTFNRLCSADLPKPSAFFNAASGRGSQERIFLAGDESGTNGYAIATVATGSSAGRAYVLGKMNFRDNGSGGTAYGGWENLLANPAASDTTLVIGTNDGGFGLQNNSLTVYVGTKTSTGTEADKAGLTNGAVYNVLVDGPAIEDRTVGRYAGARFSLSGTQATTFLRPEDGAWDTQDPNKFYFVTTDRASATGTGTTAQTTQDAASRLWRLTFDNRSNPTAGGTIDLLIDGGAGGVSGVRPEMMDNIAFDDVTGKLIISEDVGNNARNGRIWSFDPATRNLVEFAKHFGPNGDVGVAATAPFNQDEETSGQIDVTSLFTGVAGYDTNSYRYYLMADQQHYSTGSNLTVEGGQLLLMAAPVPEPSTLAMGLLGGCWAAWATWRRRQRT